jgi:hypothetical protein
VLWLADNEITEVENLSALTNLREINLARNGIERVGDVLLANPSLTSVNLADNMIGSFKEIAAVGRLPKLKELCFADPHWGDNPVSTLCNYQTYVLFTIPGRAVQLDSMKPELKAPGTELFDTKIWRTAFRLCIQFQLALLHSGLAVLDTLPLAEDTKALAEVGQCRLTRCNPGLKEPGTNLSTLTCDEPLSTFAFTLSLRRYAEATYMKKKMYYNMRAKTLRRNATNAVRRGGEAGRCRLTPG